jgi:chaperonin GroES
MRIKPLLNRVVIEQDDAQGKTLGGLILPDSAKEKPYSGKIVAKGDKATLVEVGDIVLYQKYRGTDISIDGKEYMIMQQEDILAIQ